LSISPFYLCDGPKDAALTALVNMLNVVLEHYKKPPLDGSKRNKSNEFAFEVCKIVMSLLSDRNFGRENSRALSISIDPRKTILPAFEFTGFSHSQGQFEPYGRPSSMAALPSTPEVSGWGGHFGLVPIPASRTAATAPARQIGRLLVLENPAGANTDLAH
jgi:hypothetical protein